MMQLYRCDSCTAEYVVESGQAIRCPHCNSKERTSKGEFTVEDVNLILEERKNLMEDLGERTKPVVEKPKKELCAQLWPEDDLDRFENEWVERQQGEDEEAKWIERQRREDEMSETDERDHGDQ